MSTQKRKSANLFYPHDEVPRSGSRVDICEGVQWIQMPLPFALDHVNCWLLGEPGNFTLIDCCVDRPESRDLWQRTLHDLPSNDQAVPQVTNVLVTHFHPDHCGLAGWFEHSGAKLIGSEVETAHCLSLWEIEDQDYAQLNANWYAQNGLPQSDVHEARQSGNSYKKLVFQPPQISNWQFLTEGQSLEIGGHVYTVMIGRGHAPDMLMLYREADRVLIAADQVLPRISPNVSVMPRLKDQNPLGSFLTSLQKLRTLPDDTLVLPSHGLPFKGLHARLDDVSEHHQLRLSEVLDACDQPRSAYDLFSVLFRRKLDAQQTSFALGESLAHLHYLEQQGQLIRQIDHDVTRFIRS